MPYIQPESAVSESYVVLADLNDRNANVFYELGVRHALSNRSIIIAQSRIDIPFDLKPYASHVYRWRTEQDKADFAEKVRELLNELEANPDRPDNPVSDSLVIPSPSKSYPLGFEDFRMRQHGYNGNPDAGEAEVPITIDSPETVFGLSVAAWHPQVSVLSLRDMPQFPGGRTGTLGLRVKWNNSDVTPESMIDTQGREFPRHRPNDPGEEWEPLYITFKTRTDEIWGAVTYFKIASHQKGFPEFSTTEGDAPYGWVRGRSLNS